MCEVIDQSKEYWAGKMKGFALIRRAESLYDAAWRERQYISGGVDEYGDAIPEENLEPWDALAEAVAAVFASKHAMRILKAQRRWEFCGEVFGSVSHD
ncbi:hypothetical protein [Martelella mangrovi]|uniref:DUF4376 domain-containing protein n=1 Tax=Martelella mangrovi TaxID=1397477 RepID=A0ABV2IEQ9_9HYPH